MLGGALTNFTLYVNGIQFVMGLMKLIGLTKKNGRIEL